MSPMMFRATHLPEAVRGLAVWAFVVAMAGAAGCDRGSAHAPGDSPASAQTGDEPRPAAQGQAKKTQGNADQPRDVRDLLRTLDILTAANTDPEVLTDWAFAIEADERSVDEFLDQLVETPGLGAEVAPSLIFGAYLNVHNYYVLPSGYNLRQTEPDDQGRVINYIREPCSADEAVSVRPWWDLASEVLVCPDTYRPEKWTIAVDEHEYRSRMPLACDSQVGSPEKENKSICGCGPNLIRCMPDTEQFMQYHASIKRELEMTTAHVVANDMPLDHLFSGNETFRDARSELLYRRRRIGALKIANVPAVIRDLDEWPAQGKWAPRPEVAPGEQAGLLTSHQLLNWSPDRRQRQRQIFEIMWCEGRNSFGATTEQIFEISDTPNLAFVHDSWKRLAHTELCTNCHARLDYGFQFWMGYPDARASTHFVPELAPKGEGALYSADIDDFRGKAPLTPKAFAELAMKQPEYESCMSGHVTSYVLGDRATAEDRAAVRKAFAAKHSFKEAMRVALGRYAWAWMGNHRRAQPQAKNVKHAGSRNGQVVLGSELEELLDEHCIDCHDQDKFIDSSVSFGKAFDFQGSELPRELVVRMTDHVAYHKMPKDPDAITDAQRTELVEHLIGALWADEDARKEARAYYLGQMRSLPAHQIDVAMTAIDTSAGKDPRIDWGLIERALYPDQALMTPGFLATTGLEALFACGVEGRDENPELMRCLERTFSLGRLSRWPQP